MSTTAYNTTEDQAALTAMADAMAALNTQIETTVQSAVDYTDAELAAIKAAHDALKATVDVLDPAGSAAAITAIQEFVDSVDPNGDGTIDALATLASSVTSLTARVTTAEGSIVSLQNHVNC